jgi:hypothetical protein
MSIILIMLLFPPFHVMYVPGVEIYKGYAFILNPPRFWGRGEHSGYKPAFISDRGGRGPAGGNTTVS